MEKRKAYFSPHCNSSTPTNSKWCSLTLQVQRPVVSQTIKIYNQVNQIILKTWGKDTLILASRRLNIGAFFNMSGITINLQRKTVSLPLETGVLIEHELTFSNTLWFTYLTLLPLINTCSSCETFPSCKRVRQNSNQFKKEKWKEDLIL